MKVNIPSFSENLDIELFLDWIYEMDKFFDMTYVLMETQVKFMTYKFKGGGTTWWDQLQVSQRRQGKQPMTWRRMRHLPQGRFLPPDYQQIFYNQFEQYRHGTRIVGIHEGVLSPHIAMWFISGWGAADCEIHLRFKLPHAWKCGHPERVPCRWNTKQGHEAKEVKKQSSTFQASYINRRARRR